MAKLVLVSNKHRIAGKLTKLFTGEYIYHAGWLSDEGMFYDMNLLSRRRQWPRYTDAELFLFDFPEVTTEYLEHQLTTDESTYGVWDYLLFALRPIYHLFGKSTVNVNGQICSEKCANDLRNNGVKLPWKATDPPPSPADLFRWVLTLPNRRV